MRLPFGHAARTAHLTYCTNVHPGESLTDVKRALVDHTAKIARAFSPEAPFGVGLRLSATAASQACVPSERETLRQLLSEHGLYVFTLNGFPFGTFHHARVKQEVYRPDWRTDERRRYTRDLSELLALLLPEDCDGSISTVPGGFRDEIVSEADRARVSHQLVSAAIELHQLRERTGRTIALALEPEPHCQLETLAEATTFFREQLFAASSCSRVATELGLGLADAETLLRRHLGVCLDTCHAAVEYESIDAAVTELHAAGVGVKKMQLSNALRIARVNAESIERLRAFVDHVYLHQVVERSDGRLVRFLDLPDAIESLERNPARDVEWRVHFHIPLFTEPAAPLSSTRPTLLDALSLQRRAPFTAHLEVETYTWDVLPASLRMTDLNASIVAELQFARAALASGEP